MNTESIADQLEKLDALRRNNVISDEEFSQLKAKAINRNTHERDTAAPTVSQSNILTPATGGMTKITLGLVAFFVIGGFFLFPMVNKGTGSECKALEKAIAETADDTQRIREEGRAGTALALATMLISFTQGEETDQIARRNYPSLPNFVGCTLGYYEFEWQAFEIVSGN